MPRNRFPQVPKGVYMGGCSKADLISQPGSPLAKARGSSHISCYIKYYSDRQKSDPFIDSFSMVQNSHKNFLF